MNLAQTVPRTPNRPSRRLDEIYVPRTPTAKIPKLPVTTRIKFGSTFHSPGRTGFGRDAAMITIGNRPASPPPVFSGPGPSDYAPKDLTKSGRIYHSFAKSTRSSPVATLTSNIDFIVPPRDVGIEVHIPRAERPPIYSPPQSPGPIYDIPSPRSHTSHRIGGNRTPTKRKSTDSPLIGPGTYSPETSTLSMVGGQANMSSDPHHGEWMMGPDSPGPGTYSPVDRNRVVSSPTIGRRSLPRRRYSYDPVREERRAFAIDAFIINLPKRFDEKEVLLYLTENPEVREFLHEISEIVFAEKPENPIGFIRNFYSSFKGVKESPEDVKRNIDMF